MNPADNVADALHGWANRTPAEIALIEDERFLTYRDFDNIVWRTAAALRTAGLRPGTVTGVLGGGDSTRQLAIGLALARMGAIQVALSREDTIERNEAIVRATGIRAIVSSTPDAALSSGVTAIVPDRTWFDPGAPVEMGRAAPGGDNIWLINHSSGTTGRPKAMAISHAMEAARIARQPPEFICRPGERFMSMTAFDFWLGRSRAIRCLGEGGTVVAMPQTTSVAEILATIDRHNVTHLTCAPANLHNLLPNLPEDGLRFPRLRILRVSGAALPERVLNGIRQRLSPHVYTNYGANEAGAITVAIPDMLARHPDTVGRPVPDIDFELVDDHGQRVGIGETGHVRMRSPGMIGGYLNDAEASAIAFRDGWFYPGDLATIDIDGLVFLKGRTDDVLNVEGMLVSPQEIEQVLLEHPAVADAAAFRLPSERRQDMPAAAVVLRDGASLQAVKLHCDQKLGRRSPVYVIAVHSLPRNRMGKVLRRELTRATLAALNRREQ